MSFGNFCLFYSVCVSSSSVCFLLYNCLSNYFFHSVSFNLSVSILSCSSHVSLISLSLWISVNLSVSFSVCLFNPHFVCLYSLSVCLFNRQSFCLFSLFVCLYNPQFVCIFHSIWLFNPQSFCLFSLFVSLALHFQSSVSFALFVSQSLHISVFLPHFLCLPLFLFPGRKQLWLSFCHSK